MARTAKATVNKEAEKVEKSELTTTGRVEKPKRKAAKSQVKEVSTGEVTAPPLKPAKKTKTKVDVKTVKTEKEKPAARRRKKEEPAEGVEVAATKTGRKAKAPKSEISTENEKAEPKKPAKRGRKKKEPAEEVQVLAKKSGKKTKAPTQLSEPEVKKVAKRGRPAKQALDDSLTGPVEAPKPVKGRSKSEKVAEPKNAKGRKAKEQTVPEANEEEEARASLRVKKTAKPEKTLVVKNTARRHKAEESATQTTDKKSVKRSLKVAAPKKAGRKATPRKRVVAEEDATPPIKSAKTGTAQVTEPAKKAVARKRKTEKKTEAPPKKVGRPRKMKAKAVEVVDEKPEQLSEEIAISTREQEERMVVDAEPNQNVDEIVNGTLEQSQSDMMRLAGENHVEDMHPIGNQDIDAVDDSDVKKDVSEVMEQDAVNDVSPEKTVDDKEDCNQNVSKTGDPISEQTVGLDTNQRNNVVECAESMANDEDLMIPEDDIVENTDSEEIAKQDIGDAVNDVSTEKTVDDKEDRNPSEVFLSTQSVAVESEFGGNHPNVDVESRTFELEDAIPLEDSRTVETEPLQKTQQLPSVDEGGDGQIADVDNTAREAEQELDLVQLAERNRQIAIELYKAGVKELDESIASLREANDSHFLSEEGSLLTEKDLDVDGVTDAISEEIVDTISHHRKLLEERLAMHMGLADDIVELSFDRGVVEEANPTQQLQQDTIEQLCLPSQEADGTQNENGDGADESSVIESASKLLLNQNEVMVIVHDELMNELRSGLAGILPDNGVDSTGQVDIEESPTANADNERTELEEQWLSSDEDGNDTYDVITDENVLDELSLPTDTQQDGVAVEVVVQQDESVHILRKESVMESVEKNGTSVTVEEEHVSLVRGRLQDELHPTANEHENEQKPQLTAVQMLYNSGQEEMVDVLSVDGIMHPTITESEEQQAECTPEEAIEQQSSALQLDKSIEQDTSRTEQTTTSATRSAYARFAAHAEKFWKDNETIQERADRIQQRYRQYQSRVPDCFQRLACARTAKSLIPNATKPIAVNRMNTTLPKSPFNVSSATSKSRNEGHLRTSTMPHIAPQPHSRLPCLKKDVKTLTKQSTTKSRMELVTPPRSDHRLSKRLERLATPKGFKLHPTVALTNSEEKAKQKGTPSYKPHKHMTPFMDTLGMSDNLYSDAVKKGLVPSVSHRSSTNGQN